MSIENVVTLVVAGIAFIASIIATAVSLYNARFVRFAKEKWWERQDEAYKEVFGALVGLKHSLDQWEDNEISSQMEQDYKFSPENQNRINDEFKRARNQIERAAIEGDYILSRKSVLALSQLMKELRKHSQDDWLGDLYMHQKATDTCISVLRDEAKSSLRVK